MSGIVAGSLYFVCLWWNARLFAERGGHWFDRPAVARSHSEQLGCVLTLVARQGALPLLMMALGVFIARFADHARVLRAAAP